MRVTLRSLLVLGRVSNLPTVWSNCLAGWTLAGGPVGWNVPLAALCLGVSFLYVAGMYLNDACDVDFDTAYRPERPIPAGTISRRTVTGLGVLWLAAGLLALFVYVPRGVPWAVALAVLIVIYNVCHKRVFFAPVLMAGCRELIYPTAAAATGTPYLALAHDSFSGNTLVNQAAIAMAAWILTLSVVARGESLPGSLRKVVLLGLLVPFVLGIGAHGAMVLLPVSFLLLWLLRAWLFFRATGQVGAMVGDLIAAVPLVDLMMVSPPAPADCLPYLLCFGLTLILRRSIPPT